MDNSDAAEDFHSEITELDRHLEAGAQRIKAYYAEGYERPEDYTELDRAPHVGILTDAARIFAAVADGEVTPDDPGVMGKGVPNSRIEYTLMGVGMETLLTGIYLRLDPEKFVTELEESGETPSFDDARQFLVATLADDLDNDQRRRLCNVLDFMKTHRNNLVHLAYHHASYEGHKVPVFEVVRFLLSKYADVDTEYVDSLSDAIEEIRDRRGVIYDPVAFDWEN